MTSTWRRYSVSASSTPAISAPSDIDSPAADAASPVASTTSRHAAMNSSGLCVRATPRNSGRSPSRPIAASAMAASTAWPVARSRATGPASPPPSISSRNRIGTTARSWNSSTEKLVRPVRLVMRRSSDSTCVTTAVDDIASARAATTEAVAPAPVAQTAPASAAVETSTCKPPSPNTRRRNRAIRSHDNSSPIVNISSATPSSATGSMRARSEIVTAASAGRWCTSAPSPDGPTSEADEHVAEHRADLQPVENAE